MQRAEAFLRTAIDDFKNLTNHKQVKEADEEDLEEDAHFMAIAFEDSAVRMGEKLLKSTIPQFNNNSNQLG